MGPTCSPALTVTVSGQAIPVRIMQKKATAAIFIDPPPTFKLTGYCPFHSSIIFVNSLNR